MTRLFYGSYEHPIMPAIVMTAERVGRPGGAAQAWRRHWDMTGNLHGAGPAAVQVLVDALEAAYVDGASLELRADDGTTVLDSLDQDDSLTGVRVARGPEYPEGRGAQFATHRTYRIGVEAEYLTEAAPSETAWGGYMTSEVTDGQGQVLITRSGEYTGPGRAAAAAAAKLSVGVIVLAERETDDADRRVLAFTYEYKSTGSRSVLSYVESIRLESAGTALVHRTVLDGSEPIKQWTVKRPARAWQTGEAVGLGGYPSFPAAAYAAAYQTGEVKEKHAPRRAAGGTLTEYRISWQYSFEFATQPSFVSPGTPPA